MNLNAGAQAPEAGGAEHNAQRSPVGSVRPSLPAWPAWKPRLSQREGLRLEGGRRLHPTAAPAGPRQGPLVSYITVVKNAASTLERMLRSVAAQTWPHVEHIVLDGLSTDGTLDIIARHADALDYFASAPDGGLYEALNNAIECATGDLICVLNADDWLTPDAAARVAHAHAHAHPHPHPHAEEPAADARLWLSAAWVMEDHPGPGRVAGPHGQSQTLWLPTRLTAAAVLSCANVCHNAVYATRAAYEASGPYRQDLRIAADFAWLVQCQRAGVRFDYLDQPTIHYSVGGMSSDKKRHTQDCVHVLRQQVPALSEAEAWGLLHCFHIYGENMLAYPHSKPAHHGKFLLDLAQRHAGDAYLMQALALASVARLAHPADGRATGKLTQTEKLARSLHKRKLALRALWQRLA